MTDDLSKNLSLKDLIFFGVISIFGSGGFNLIGHAIAQGGNNWPLALTGAAALFLGSSRTYEEAYKEFKKNTSESDFLEKIFGKEASYLTIASILIFNIFSMATILVLCVRMIVPDFQWLLQSILSISIVVCMGFFSLQGIQANKGFVNVCSSILITLLSGLSLLGFGGIVSKGLPSIPAVSSIPEPSLTQSFLYFFYILAGFDVLMKFSEETKNPDDVPRSFYISNILAVIFVLGLTLSVIIFTDLKKGHLEQVIGTMLSNLIGRDIKTQFSVIAVFFMIVTMFVTFLATTRYMFSLGKNYEALKNFTHVNEKNAPTIPILVTTAVVSLTILINHFNILITVADIALGGFLFLVASAATKYKFDKGEFPLIEGATAATFLGIFGLGLVGEKLS